MSRDAWTEAVAADPRRRDREAALAGAVAAGVEGAEPAWASLGDPELRRRAGYLLDVAQTMRGQTAEEAERLGKLRAALGLLELTTFWPGEPELPAGTDPVAERWGYRRGCNLMRLKAALRSPAPASPAAGRPPAPSRAS